MVSFCGVAVEILGQVFDAQTMTQMAASQEQLQQMMDQRMAEAAAMSAEAAMSQLFGEDMGVLADRKSVV